MVVDLTVKRWKLSIEKEITMDHIMLYSDFLTIVVLIEWLEYVFKKVIKMC